jgi:hypothetical protein
MTAVVLAAALVRLAIPDFAAEGLSSLAGQQLGAEFRNAVASEGCAEVVAESPDFSACAADAACQSRVARRIGAEYVLRGRVRGRENESAVTIDLVSVDSGDVRGHFEDGVPSRAAPHAVCEAIRTTSKSVVLNLELPRPGTPTLPRAAVRGAGGDAGDTEIRIPLRYIVLGSAALTGLLGIGLGGASAAIWGRDHPKTVNSVTYHTIPVGDARAANSDAVGADVFFAFTGALALTGGVMVLYRW